MSSFPSLMGVPSHCLAGGAVALGAAAVATTLHTEANVPKVCIASSIVGSTALVSALSHHGTLSKSPAAPCIAGSVAGFAVVGYALSSHSAPKMPFHCKMYTAAGLAVLLASVTMMASFAKK